MYMSCQESNREAKKSDRLHGNIPSPKGSVNSQRKALQRGGGSPYARIRPERGGAAEGPLGDGCVCVKRATRVRSSPSVDCFTRHPPVVLVLQRGRGAGFARGGCIVSDGILRSVSLPLRRGLCLSHAERDGEFARAMDGGDSPGASAYRSKGNTQPSLATGRSGPVRVTNGGGNPGLVVTFTVGSASQGRRGLIK